MSDRDVCEMLIRQSQSVVDANAKAGLLDQRVQELCAESEAWRAKLITCGVMADDDLRPSLYEVGGLLPEFDSEAARKVKGLVDRLEKSEAQLIEAKRLLSVAACPANCTDGAYPDHYGDPVQCQFCYERKEVSE